MATQSGFAKKAVIYGNGEPHPHLICVCGAKVAVLAATNMCAACATVYDRRGWIRDDLKPKSADSCGLRFLWNGIKGSDGKLQRCSYSDGQLMHFPEGTITIYAKCRFTADVRAVFHVENDSDCQTDYFEDDRIRVTPLHPLYGEVHAAMKARTAHYEKVHDRSKGKLA